MEISFVYGLVLLGLTTLGGYFGAFLNSYSKTKGKNLATHEDIDKLVDEVRAVTTATKQIEAKISNEVWDRQKRWELTRDAVLQTLKALSEVREPGTDGAFPNVLEAAGPRSQSAISTRHSASSPNALRPAPHADGRVSLPRPYTQSSG